MESWGGLAGVGLERSGQVRIDARVICWTWQMAFELKWAVGSSAEFSQLTASVAAVSSKSRKGIAKMTRDPHLPIKGNKRSFCQGEKVNSYLTPAPIPLRAVLLLICLQL